MRNAPPFVRVSLTNATDELLKRMPEIVEILKACGAQHEICTAERQPSLDYHDAYSGQAQVEQPQTPQAAVMPQNPTSKSPPPDSLHEDDRRSGAMIAASPASLRQLLPPTSTTTFRSWNCRPCDLAAALDVCRSGRELCSRVNLSCLENIERALRRWRRRDGSPEMRFFVVTALARVKNLKSCP